MLEFREKSPFHLSLPLRILPLSLKDLRLFDRDDWSIGQLQLHGSELYELYYVSTMKMIARHGATKRRGASVNRHRRDNNVWLTCNWTTLDNPIGLYTNWTIPNGSQLFNRSHRVYIVAVLFSMAGIRCTIVIHWPPPRNCLIRSAGQKIRMGSSAIPVYIYVYIYGTNCFDVDVTENIKLPSSYRNFTLSREWSPRMKNKIVSLNDCDTNMTERSVRFLKLAIESSRIFIARTFKHARFARIIILFLIKKEEVGG